MLAPHLTPPENVAIGHIERLVLAGLLGAAPLHGLCQQLHINHLQQGMVGLWRPWESAAPLCIVFCSYSWHVGSLPRPKSATMAEILSAERAGVQL